MGVFLLLSRFGASLEEQVAGLIHDVSHSAFSHVIDYVVSGASEEAQDHQDNIFLDFVRKTEIPLVLKKYSINLDYVLDDKNFPLKERELPDLCADRIEYSLRGSYLFLGINKKEIRNFLDSLVVENNNWVFKNLEAAKQFASLFLKMNRKYYSGKAAGAMLRTSGNYLKYALASRYIDLSDLYNKTDKEVIRKINKFLDKDSQLSLLWERMNGKKVQIGDNKSFNEIVFCKSRIVDPLFYSGDRVLRLSEMNHQWKEVVRKEMKPKKHYLKFI